MLVSGHRSLGRKLLLICVLAALMSLPAFAVFGLILERTHRAEAVVREVGATFGGEQAFSGPMLAAPYKASRTVNGPDGKLATEFDSGWYVVFPAAGTGDGQVDVDVRQRGSLFKVRTYRAGVKFEGDFDLTGEPSAAPEGAIVDWGRAVLLIGVSDPRGAQKAEVRINGGEAQKLQPGTAYSAIPANLSPNGGEGLKWLKLDMGEIVRPDVRLKIAADLAFTGVESVTLSAFAKDTKLSLMGNWPHVSYSGAFPSSIEAAPAGGFLRRWSIPYVARGLDGAGVANATAISGNLAVSARLLDPANPYKAVERSLKYALMFIGLIFLAFFVLETVSGKRVHPAQYVLIGLAQVVFYLLLLSIAERTGFDIAFLIAAGATVALISSYAGTVFESRARGLVALLVFSALYGLIYMLMRLEDFALLAGALAAFAAIAGVMFFTRRVSWYDVSMTGQGPPASTARPPMAAPSMDRPMPPPANS